MPDSPINNYPIYTLSNNYGKSLSHLNNRKSRGNVYISKSILASNKNNEEIHYHDNNNDHTNQYHGGEYEDHDDDHHDDHDDYSKIANQGSESNLYQDEPHYHGFSILENKYVIAFLFVILILFIYKYVFNGEIKLPNFNFGKSSHNFRLSDTF